MQVISYDIIDSHVAVCLCARENKTRLAEHKYTRICPMVITRLRCPPTRSTVKFKSRAKAYQPSYLVFYDSEGILVYSLLNGSVCV